MPSIEEEIFRRKKPRPDRFAAFGFRKEGEVWKYSEPFMNGDFRAEVEVSPDGKVRGKVIDAIAEEEYLPLRIEERTGAFVGAVRLAYAAILEKIARECFEEEPFSSPQANRLARAVAERYSEYPDYPFAGEDDCGVFRRPENRKWYGLIMNVPRSRLTKEPKREGEPTVDVLNLKIAPEEREAALALPGVYPAYHMNHEKWISIALDERLQDETILHLLDGSRRLAGAKGAKGAKGKIKKE